jgi:hypothetical protein
MNSRDAKQMLWIYRAGTDRDEPQFADALSVMEGDPELRCWVEQQDVVFHHRLLDIMPFHCQNQTNLSRLCMVSWDLAVQAQAQS